MLDHFSTENEITQSIFNVIFYYVIAILTIVFESTQSRVLRIYANVNKITIFIRISLILFWGIFIPSLTNHIYLPITMQTYRPFKNKIKINGFEKRKSHSSIILSLILDFIIKGSWDCFLAIHWHIFDLLLKLHWQARETTTRFSPVSFRGW